MIEENEVLETLTNLLRNKTTKRILNGRYKLFSLNEEGLVDDKYDDLIFIEDKKDAPQPACAVFKVFCKDNNLSVCSNSQNTQDNLCNEFIKAIDKINSAIGSLINQVHYHCEMIYGYIILITDNLDDVIQILRGLDGTEYATCHDILESINSTTESCDGNVCHILIHKNHYECVENYTGRYPKYTCYYQKICLD